jgi:hypothetical protein
MPNGLGSLPTSLVHQLRHLPRNHTKHALPVPELGLAEQPSRRVPGAIRAIEHPAPVPRSAEADP